ncbi:cyanate transport system protein [Halalkalibacter wakoensis JCM 9140]|uniref:Cyanate transport system protein n=1 Tax=Halalkalibacter wakoensis JCM 9140 TaxID=1236970 RepID=W4Q3M6_9BACI|nr:MFS transporter [Halalkalibacter wakoensis]GAE26582.1 cyanate transport system protein [Halalkalibacter wakoensis JCM 9140]
MKNRPIITIPSLLFLFGLVLVAFNLRSSITAVGPLISTIRLETNLSNSVIGMLTTLPLLAFGVFSTVAPKISRRWGNETTVFIALIILTIGILLRSTGMVFTLFLGTAMLGLGIAICNVLLPSIVKGRYPKKMGLLTGIYSTSMALMAALASGLSIPLAHRLNLGWESSLALWAILAGLAVVVWIPQLFSQKINSKAIIPKNSNIWSSKLAWQVTLFMGLQSCIFYCIIAWIPEILVSRGIDVPTAGWLLTLTQLVGLPATLLVPILATRMSNQKIIVLAITFLYFLGFLGIYLGGSIMFIIVCMVFLGLAQGAGISLSLSLFGLRSENAHDAANLSGMAQSGGYLLAATGPLLLGLFYDLSQSWSIGFLFILTMIMAMGIFGVYASRDRYVFQLEQEKLRA